METQVRQINPETWQREHNYKNLNSDLLTTEHCELNYHITVKHRLQTYRAPIYCKPRFTVANFFQFPQIGLNMHIVYKENPDLPQTPIYRGCFLSPKTSGKLGFNSNKFKPTTVPKTCYCPHCLMGEETMIHFIGLCPK